MKKRLIQTSLLFLKSLPGLKLLMMISIYSFFKFDNIILFILAPFFWSSGRMHSRTEWTHSCRYCFKSFIKRSSSQSILFHFFIIRLLKKLNSLPRNWFLNYSRMIVLVLTVDVFVVFFVVWDVNGKLPFSTLKEQVKRFLIIIVYWNLVVILLL